MKRLNARKLCFTSALLVWASLPLQGTAQTFNSPGNGDLLAGFRKVGTHQGTNELVVFLGNITNLLSMTPGTTMTMANVPAARLTDAFSTDYTYIQWSVFGANYNVSASWVTPLGSFPLSTIWYTLPRTSASTQSTPINRLSKSSQAGIGTKMNSIGLGAAYISTLLGTTDANNSSVLVREPLKAAYLDNDLSSFMGDLNDATLGDFGGDVVSSVSFEQTNSSPFSAATRADLYQSAPAASTRPTTYYTDPITGSTSSVYYVGYFEFSPSGTFTFTRATQAAPLPPAPSLTISAQGSTNKIFFYGSNGANYTLIYTNLSGLAAARSNWPSLGSAITGVGAMTNFVDISAAAGRVYSVKAH